MSRSTFCICPSPTPNTSFNEEETLDAMRRFRKFYEKKLREIDLEGGGDSMELKIKLQERWIKDLTEQTEMMAKIVKELEDEATNRVKMLEDKLKQSSKAAYELTKDNAEKVSVEIEGLKKKLKKAEEKMRHMQPIPETRAACTCMDQPLELEICRRQCEVDDLRSRCCELERALESSQARAENLQKAEAKSATRTEVKKLRQQKRCYEQAIECFRNEMAVMSEQLVHLQEILKLSNQSCKEENGQLFKAIVDLQQVCDRLQTELIKAEKKIVAENQISQLKDNKIQELHLIIGQKNADLNMHDQAINEMKKKLENSVIENHELQNKIVALNSTVMQLQCALAGMKDEGSKQQKIIEPKKSITTFQDEVESKNRKLERLEADYRAQHEVLKTLQEEFEKVREKERAKVRTLKHQNDVLQDKLATNELKHQHLMEELGNLRDQANDLVQKECCREHELAQSKQMVSELRQANDILQDKLRGVESKNQHLTEEVESLRDQSTHQAQRECSQEHELVQTKLIVLDLRQANEALQEKLVSSEVRNHRLMEEIANLKDRSSHLAQEEVSKEHELAQSKQIILELRQTLIDLNESLAESEFHQKSLANIFQKKMHDDRHQEDIYLSSQCEIALYKKLVEDFKKSIAQARKNLTEMETQNKHLREELKQKDKALGEIRRTLAKHEKDTYQHIRELTEKLQRSQNEEKRLSCFIDNLKAEIQRRVCQNHENKELKTEACACLCGSDVEMASTQEEIGCLKIEIKRMIQNQLALNNENDKLLKQVTNLQAAITSLEEKNRNLKQKLEKAQSENKKFKETNMLLQHEKDAYNQTIRNLEIELAEARHYRDDICAESKHVMNNVKAWLEEQKKINDKVKKRAQCYCDTIAKLKQENTDLLNQPCVSTIQNKKTSRNVNPLVAQLPSTILECESPWGLDSQGMESPRDSPSSFLTCSVEEWYSPNYRDETDFESDHEAEFVSRLEAATLEMKANNRKWKHKCRQNCECFVSKDDK